ncbi:MAG: hypothetical protein COX57_12155 [Alphaproteobacteria bacterium CG_4_10_14_0_2_um_filter_63_37]|nr:MAG: hypothetical protein AUJ55_09645 [Proteobacteria bacterium CG1_02_64_396]PJA23729.1 MAG: hypothetical protein COX57_12155 [Alphaproteobacteria bacterium CG_4_10_14_0_2_um_filter_63_37]
MTLSPGTTARLIALYVWLIRHTVRWRILGAPPEGQVVIVAWHERLSLFPLFAPRRPTHCVISNSRDGEIVSTFFHRFGIEAIRGSGSKGSAGAIRGLLRSAQEGVSLGITPDGPRGPRRSVAQGAVEIAQRYKLPIVPFAFATSRFRQLRSWDRHFLPLPFGRGVFVWGDPVDLGGLSKEQAKARVAAALNEVTARADAEVGITTI